MICSGLTILAFVIYHLLHFTVGLDNEYDVENGPYYLPNGHHDVYNMVIDGFSHLRLRLLHHRHGPALPPPQPRLLQRFPDPRPRTKRSGPPSPRRPLFAAVIFLGNISIPLAILLGFVS